MREYMILRIPGQAALSDDLSPRSVSDITIERLEDEHAAQAASEPDAVAVAPVMPIRLIEPMDVSAAAALDAAWGIGAVGADQSPFDGSGIRVAVLDTGIDDAHPAFAGVTLNQLDFSGDGDGDVQGHGTHCAGTIFGRDVGQRIGVAPGVTEAWIGKVLDDTGHGSSEMLFNALHWAMQNKVHVISMSLGFDFPGMVKRLIEGNWPKDLATSVGLEAYRSNLRMFDAIMAQARAMSALGGSPTVIAAAGNESKRGIDRKYRIAASLPAAAQDVMSVAALRQDGSNYAVANFSNSFATLAAPGQDIISAKPGGGTQSMSGTSMACPHVAGVAALWWQKLLPGGTDANGVMARMRASCSRGQLGPSPDWTDVGEGLISAPLP